MHSIAPIAAIQSDDATRRALHGWSADGAPAPERPRSWATRLLRAQRRTGPAGAHSGSDQCSIVAARENPARA